MMQSITIRLPEEIKQALDDFSREQGISADEVVGRAVRQHLFLRRFRSLRERLLAKVQSDNGLTDDGVEVVSPSEFVDFETR